MKAIRFSMLSLALGAALPVLSAGCYPYAAKAEAVGREWESVRKRTQPDDRLNAMQRAKVLQDEDALSSDIAALASGR